MNLSMTGIAQIVLPIVLICCQSNVWNGIVPLKSTRADVEKILGSPVPDSIARDAAVYKTKTEKVFVLYSTGPCDTTPSNGWNLPELTVISIRVYPVAEPKLEDLKLDFSKFERRIDPKILNLVYYANDRDGINISVDTTDNTVTRIGYFPESKNNNLLCKKQK